MSIATVLSLLGDIPSEDLVAAAWFALAIGLMDRFDISLPRGDSIGVSGALVAAGTMVAGLGPMSVLSILVLVVSHIGRSSRSQFRLRGALYARVLGLGSIWLIAPMWASTGLQGRGMIWLVGIPTVFLLAEVFAAQSFLAHESGRPLHRLLAGNYRRQGPLVAAQVSASVLATITYADMKAWGLVLVVALLLLMRQSLALLLEIRETYRTTVEVLVEAAEGQDVRRQGHADRTAKVAREIATRMGLSPTDVETVSYASLLHDLDALSAPTSHTPPLFGQSANVFQGTAFFDDVLPVLRICDGRASQGDETEANLMTAMLVALASDVDMNRSRDVAEAHAGSSVARVSAGIPSSIKAKVVAAAIELGYQIPAVT